MIVLFLGLALFLLGRVSRIAQVEPLRGVGDLVAYVTAALFISATGNCGCKARRARWNARWPFPWAAYRPRPLTPEERDQLRAWMGREIDKWELR